MTLSSNNTKFRLPFGRASSRALIQATSSVKSILLPPSSVYLVDKTNVDAILETSRPRARTWRPAEKEIKGNDVDEVDADPRLLALVQEIQRCVRMIKDVKEEVDRAHMLVRH